ncbi:Cellulose synthase-like protein E1 [Linum perenne]
MIPQIPQIGRNVVLVLISNELDPIQKLYEEMKDRIEIAIQLGRIPEPEESLLLHKSFFDDSAASSWKRDHPTILQILIDGRRDSSALNNNNGSICGLPTLVYMAREKRPHYHHNFKAGAMNALIRVSSKISNAPILLNLDCDMYSNDPSTLKDALCFFMDEEKNHDIAFLQFPQLFDNVTQNDIYSSSLLVISNVEFHGLDGYGGPLYIGSGAFHRRDTLCGRNFHPNDSKLDWLNYGRDERMQSLSVQQLVEEATPFADCASEDKSLWGKQMGLKYGCPVEDVITGLSIQCKGWKSVYYNPKREAFLGKAPTTWPQTLVQHKRWSEGDFQIFLSKFSPAWYAHGKISIGLRMMYLCYCLWAPNCFPLLYYTIIPSLCLLKGIPLFPQVSSPWFLPFAYVIFANYMYSLLEFLNCGGTILGWWNEQRTWLYKRTCSYLFAFVDTILKIVGFGESGFVITAKVADDDVGRRYKEEIMEFGSSSAMFNILGTIAVVNLLCIAGIVKRLVGLDEIKLVFDEMGLQILLCGALVIINWPLYKALFIRMDKGRMPTSVTVNAFILASLTCMSFLLL